MADKIGFSTKAIHSDDINLNWPGSPVVPGISLSTTFKQKSPGEAKYEYSRSGNPTRETLEKSLAVLEHAKYGLAFASGLSAETTILHLLKTGDEIVCVDDVYGGTNRLFNRVFNNFGIKIKMINICDEKILRESLTNQTAMVWVETPTNPTLKIVDIAMVKRVVSQQSHRILLIVDNTFLSPYFQNPLNHGADIVIHSVTKYINGHSDVVMGSLMLNDEELYKKLVFYQNACGPVPSPFDCYLVLRGIKTLALRMEKHQENAIKIARHFSGHPLIKQVMYPGLETHPSHLICKSQCSGYGGIITLKMNANLEQTTKFLKELKIFAIAESLGGYESLCEHPAIMTHASVPLNERKKLGIDDSLLRFSVGIEDSKDLIEDIEQALNKINSV